MNDQRSTLDQNSSPARRSQGQIIVARALWYAKPGHAEFRTERLQPLEPDKHASQPSIPRSAAAPNASSHSAKCQKANGL